MAEWIDRKRVKAEAKELLRDAQVSHRAMVTLYLGLVLFLALGYSLVSQLTADMSAQTVFGSPVATFVYILVLLMDLLLQVGFYLYCMGIRRGERMEFLTLFDAFSFAGRLISLAIIQYVFIFLWSMLFMVPGIIAAYRYRFAYLNLCEDPSLSPFQALDMSKRQTAGYKAQIFALDLSYLGWGILTAIPSLLVNFSVTFSVMQAAGVPIPVDLSWISSIPSLLTTLVIGLWSLLVSLWFLANYQVCEISYFETAKRTSGVGVGLVPRDPGPGGGMF